MTDIALISNNSQDILEIVKISRFDVGSATLSTSAPGAGNFTYAETIISQAHNLGYTPLLQAYEDATSGVALSVNLTSYSAFGGTGTGLWFDFEAYADNSSVYWIAKCLAYGQAINFSNGGGGVFTKIYLLREKAG